MMKAGEYLQHILSVLAAFEFSFDAVAAYGYPLTVLLKSDRTVISPELLNTKLPQILEIAAMTKAMHEMTQIQNHDNVFMLRHAETKQLISEYCFKLMYFHKSDIEDLSLVQQNPQTNQYVAHPFVLDALAMFGMQKLHPELANPIHGSFIIKWHSGPQKSDVRVAGLIVMKSIHKFVTLHDYLTKTLNTRMDVLDKASSMSTTEIEFSPKPVGKFLQELLPILLKQLQTIQNGTLSIHHYRLHSKNILLNPESGKWLIKDFGHCGLVLPSRLLCAPPPPMQNKSRIMEFVSAEIEFSSPSTRLAFNAFSLLLALQYEFLMNEYPIRTEDHQELQAAFRALLTKHHQTESSFVAQIIPNHSCVPNEDCKTNELVTLQQSVLQYNTGTHKQQYQAMLRIADLIRDFPKTQDIAKHAKRLYMEITAMQWTLHVPMADEIRRFQSGLAVVLLGEFALCNWSLLLSVTNFESDDSYWDDILTAFDKDEVEKAQQMQFKEEAIFLRSLLEQLPQARKQQNSEIVRLATQLLNKIDQTNLDFGSSCSKKNVVQNKVLTDEMESVLDMLDKNRGEVLVALETHKKQHLTKWSSADEVERPLGQVFEKEDGQEEEFDVIPSNSAGLTTRAIEALPVTSLVALPYMLKRVDIPFTGRTFDNLIFDMLVGMCRYLTCFDIWESLQQVSIYFAQLIRSEAFRKQFPEAFWQIRLNILEEIPSANHPPHLLVTADFYSEPKFLSYLRLGNLRNISFGNNWDEDNIIRPTIDWSCLRSFKLAENHDTRRLPDELFYYCVNLEKVAIIDCEEFDDVSNFLLQNAKPIKTVTLYDVPVEDISSLGLCDCVVIEKCSSIQDYNVLKDCQAVFLLLLDRDCAPFDELMNVPKLTITVQVGEPLSPDLFMQQPNHQHRRLHLKHLDDVDFVNLKSVNNLLVCDAHLSHVDHLRHFTTLKRLTLQCLCGKNDAVEMTNLCNVLENMVHLETLTVGGRDSDDDEEDIWDFSAVFRALGKKTHIRTKLPDDLDAARQVMPALSTIRRLTLVGGESGREILSEVLPHLEKVEELWLELFTGSRTNWKALLAFLQASDKPSLKVYWNDVYLNDDVIMTKMKQAFERIENSGLMSKSDYVGISPDGRTWIRCNCPPPSIDVLNMGDTRARSESGFYFDDVNDKMLYSKTDIHLACVQPLPATPVFGNYEQKVDLFFADETMVSLSRAQALGSQLLYNMIEETYDDNVQIPLPNIPDTNLFQYAYMFLDALSLGKKISNLKDDMSQPMDILMCQTTLTRFERHWLQQVSESGRLIDVLFMANYLHIQPMMELLLFFLATVVKGRTPADIQSIFHLPDTETSFQDHMELLQDIRTELDNYRPQFSNYYYDMQTFPIF